MNVGMTKIVAEFYAVLFCLILWQRACGTDLYVEDSRSSIRMLVLADWGGNEIAPYTTPSQRYTSEAMGIIGIYLTF